MITIHIGYALITVLYYSRAEKKKTVSLQAPLNIPIKGNIYIEYTMIVSFDIKFIRSDQKTHRNGKALPSHPAFSLMYILNTEIFMNTEFFLWFYLPKAFNCYFYFSL